MEQNEHKFLEIFKIGLTRFGKMFMLERSVIRFIYYIKSLQMDRGVKGNIIIMNRVMRV